MKSIVAPEEYVRDLTIFLGGGITDCPEWQTELTQRLVHLPVVLFNPRRGKEIRPDGEEAKLQIKWEYKYLEKADIIVFWFPAEGKCMITLLELGAYSSTKKPLIIGVDNEYVRKLDVYEQVALRRPELSIVSSLDDIIQEIEFQVRKNNGETE